VVGSELAAMCERTLDEVYRYALRLCGGDADRTKDLVQETYTTLLRHLDAHPDAEVGLGWLITCCRHRHVDGFRRVQRRERNQRRAWQPQPDAEIAERSDVVEALGRIPEPGRTALVMRHVEGLSVAEIAGELGRSVEATDSILRRSRQRLRDEYGRVQQGSIDR
jgi:RNA polymerase sigma-70 factor, ECF subfamily